jgi:hypothetical protein
MEDVVFEIIVIDKMDNTVINNIDISIAKVKPGAGFMNKVVVETYSGTTNSEGEVSFFIDNYNRDNYSYSIIVNDFNGVPENYGGYGYSKYGTLLYPEDLGDVFFVRLGRILFSDSISCSNNIQISNKN